MSAFASLPGLRFESPLTTKGDAGDAALDADLGIIDHATAHVFTGLKHVRRCQGASVKVG